VIDFHCHLDLYRNPGEVLRESVRRSCYVLAVTTTPLAWNGTLQLVGGSPRIQVALGLHPELVAERYREVAEFRRLLPEAKYVGEIGLDGSARFKGSFDLQKRVLRELLLATAEAGGRIMSIHSRAASSEVLDALAEHPGSGTPVLHWFMGNGREVRRATELGCWFSVGPAMLRTKRGIQVLGQLPPNRVLTETDGPFTESKGQALNPWDTSIAVSGIASAWEISPQDANRRIRSNLRTLLGERSRTSGHPATSE